MNNESDNKLVLLNVETVKEKQSEEEGTERKNEENNDNNGKNYQIITHQGNVMVNHISIKKVEQNFNTAQKIELNSQHSKSKEEIESVKEEVKEEEEDKKSEEKPKKKKKLRVQRTKAPPELLKQKHKHKGGGLFFCCIPTKNK